MGYELYQSRHKGYEIDNLLDDVQDIKPKVAAMEQGYDANKVKMADGSILPTYLALQMASKSDISNMATNASVATDIQNATKDFISSDAIDNKITNATKTFVDGNTVDNKISTATANFATSGEVDAKITSATSDFIKDTDLDTKITNATKDFITSSAVDTKITNATSEFVTSNAVDAKITNATASFVTGDVVDNKITNATKDFVTDSIVDSKISTITKDFVDSDTVDGKITEATKDFVTEDDVNSIIDDDFTNKGTLDKLSTSEDGTLLFNGEEIKGGGTNIEVNPSDDATETLTKIKIEDTIYEIEGGGTEVEGNPEEDATEDLTKVKIGETVYGLSGGGTDVEANPLEFATEDLETIKIGETVYGIPEGGGSGRTVSSIDVAPVGTIIPFMGKTAPKNYLICNGAIYEIAKFKELSDFIKAQFGSYNFFGGNGTTTFAVPDLRGEFLRGAGANGHTGQGAGAAVGVHQAATQIPDSYGTYNGTILNKYYSPFIRYNGDISDDEVHYNFVENPDSAVNGTAYAKYAGQGFAPSSYTGTSSTKRYAFTARPTNTAVLYCIKYTIKENIDVNVIAGYEDYSEEEIIIGRWINGKPIYRKYFKTNSPICKTEGTAVTLDLNVETYNIDNIVKIQGTLNNTLAVMSMPAISNATGGGGVLYWYKPDTKKIRISNNFINYNDREIIIFIDYTKTTDALDSFRPDMLKTIPLANDVTEEEIMTVINVLKEAE